MRVSINPASRGMRGALMLACATLGTALAQTPAQLQLRELYRELVEINTTDSAGSCTVAAEAMKKRMVAGGIPATDVQIIVPPGNPKKGNLIVRYRGTGAKKPLLLLGHLDVVEAKREDWTRDPFKLIEEGGYFYARGAADDKSMVAVFLDNFLRYRREGYRPERDIIGAFTCDEEIIPSKFNGAEYLLKNHRSLIDAEFALNEGSGGLLDGAGKPVRMGIQAGEKVFQTYTLEVTNRGGHSSVPVKDNAITHLAGGLARLGAFDWPFKLSDTTRTYFERMAALESPQTAADMRAILRNPPDAEALARLSQNPSNNSTYRTTCVATMLDAGHALEIRARGIGQLERPVERAEPGQAAGQVRDGVVLDRHRTVAARVGDFQGVGLEHLLAHLDAHAHRLAGAVAQAGGALSEGELGVDQGTMVF